MRKLTLKEVPLVKQAILSRRQGFKCALCPQTLTVMTGCLDHDHYTGLVRGVLCRNCNGIEGKIKNLVTRARRTMDHDEYLQKLKDYWTLHKEDRTGLIYPSHLTVDEKRVKRNIRAKKLRAAKKAKK